MTESPPFVPSAMQGELCNIAHIVNQRGLHARAAVRLAKLAATFNAEITVVKDDLRVVVTEYAVLDLMMLGAGCGTTLKICGSGPEAHAAVTALSELVKRKFDEE